MGLLPGLLLAFRDSFSELVADARLARTEGLFVKPPAKGVRRSVLCCGWVVLHVFELVVLLGYGAFPKGPAHAVWWLLATLLAGVLYVRVCFSDPGFLSPLTVQRMADDLGLDVTVAGSDATRGLLEDVEAPLPRMQEMLPVPEQPDGPAEPASTSAPPSGGGGGVGGGRARVMPVADGAAGSSSMHAAAAAGTEGIELTEGGADGGPSSARDGGAAGAAAAQAGVHAADTGHRGEWLGGGRGAAGTGEAGAAREGGGTLTLTLTLNLNLSLTLTLALALALALSLSLTGAAREGGGPPRARGLLQRLL